MSFAILARVLHFAAVQQGAPAWISARVVLCGIAAVVLLMLALFLRGLQKVVTLLLALVLVAGVYWLIRDAALHRNQVLPPALESEMKGLANRALESPAAKSAWESIERELPRVTGDLRDRLSAGGDHARKYIATRLDAKAAELRKAGKRAAADELMRLKAKVSP